MATRIFPTPPLAQSRVEAERRRGPLEQMLSVLADGEIPGTGRRQRIVFNDSMEEIRRESLLADLRQRIRDVRQRPDELLYVLTDKADGVLLG